MSLLTAEKRKLLAQKLKERGIDPGARAEPIPRRPPGLARPSFAQQRLWVLDQLEPGSPFYNIAAAADLLGRLDLEVLARSFGEIVRRHEALRTVFVSREGQPFQEVLEPPAAWPLPLVDLTALPEAAGRAEADRLALAEARRPFDLARGPLLRTTLLRLGPEEHALLVTMHHIISDGWSHGVFLREMAALYAAFSAGRPAPLQELPELPVQYPDFAEWQREWLSGERLETQLAYWRRRLGEGPPPLELPADRPRPPLQTYHGARVPVAVPREVTDALAARGREEAGTLFMVLLAAFDALLARHTGQTDVAVGSPVANRRRADLEGLIGFFTNTLVLRLDAGGAPTFRELLGRARDTAQEAYAHQDIPFERLVEELQPERDASRTPLFQVMLVLQNAPAHGLEIPGLRVVRREGDPGVAKFDLMLDLTEAPDGLRGALEYNTDLYDGTRVQRLAGHLLALLEGAATDPHRRLSDLPLLSEPERHQVVAEWNAPPTTIPLPTVVSAVEEQALRHPEAMALEDPAHGIGLTYAELVRRAEGLARRLQKLGVGPETRVAISLERSAAMAVLVLGVLRAGGAYVPVDPAYPEERRALMLADSGAQVVLDRQKLSEIERMEEGRGPLPPPDPGSLAYVLFTSGSTGRPKGVAMPHGALANMVAWQLADTPGRFRTLQFASLSFDVSFQEIFATWCAGGTLILAGDEVRRDPAALLDFLADRSVERLFLPFVALQGLAEAAQGRRPPPGSLKEVMTAGEALQRTPAVVSLFRELPGTRLHNQYGPTEAHVVTSQELTGDPEAWPLLPPIGRPISGDQAYVLDRDGKPAPLGVPGELALGGAGLARGYLGRPDLTAERFVPDPFGTGARLYRTGDLGRFRADGALEFLGRIDQQVKVRGFRVEPGEVEAALAAHPSVREAAVTVEGEGAARRLVGYVTGTADPAELRRFLSGRLPEYLVPAALVTLEALPLTPSGKVDRRALGRHAPRPALAEEGFVAPRTPAEEVLAGIWMDVLGLERVGAYDDFFTLGGHSLLGTQVVSRIRGAFGVELPLRALFEEPTLSGLARRIEAAFRAETGGEAPPLAAVPRDGRELPLSFAQQRLWFIDQLDPGTPRYNIPLALRLEGALDVPALENAISEVVRRHEALRTAFAAAGLEPVQIVLPAVPVPLPVVDLAALPAATRNAEAADLAGREAARPFDLSEPPWLRSVLLREDDGAYQLLLTQHHIASDGWSIGVLVRELTALYSAFSAGQPSPLPPLPVQYADFAVWQRSWLQGEALDRELGYWREGLAGLPSRLDLPADRSPAVPSYRGGKVDVRLGAELTEAVRQRARQSGATVFMVLLAAWQALLARLSGQPDLAVGTPIAGRNRLETEGLIGFFVNALVLRASMADDPPFSEHLARTREAALGAFAHPDLPFEKLVEELAPERHLGHTPLFQVMFILQNTPLPELALPGLQTAPVPVASGAVRFELTLSLTEAGTVIAGTAEFAADRFDAVTVQRWVGGFETLLRDGLDSPGTPVSALPVLREPERFQVVTEWNDTAGDLPDGSLGLHELFEAQVDRTPGAVAVSADDGTLTYRDLDDQAGALAWRLREVGVGPEVRVGVFAERSLEAVVGYVAVAKAGGVFVPLDPDYPRERLAYLVEDADLSLVLAQDRLRDRLPGSLAVFALDGALAGAAEGPARLAPAVTPDHAAYVLYTSGSTGRPKGVVVSHRAIVNRLHWGQEAVPFSSEDRILQKTPPSFDVSVTELFSPLVAGARLVVSAPGEHRDPAAMVARTLREGVTYLQVVPTLLRLLLEEPDLQRCASLRWLVCGGEALDRDSVERVLARLPVTLLNFYGPAEAAVDTTWRPFRRGERSPIVPIGRPVTNLRVYVVDRALRPAPVGVPGELCVAGTGLARGYLGRPDLTAERFLPDPFASSAGERLYRTGDLARWLPQGEIDYLGRIDHQIKLRGVRIELEEIEAVLAGHSAVRQAAVVVRGEGADRRLVGYVLPRANAPAEIEADLRSFLRESLPEAMVPAAIVVLDELPLTPSGKVDRLRLLREAPEPERDGGAAGVAPRTPVEETLAGIWAEVLRVGRVGIRDDFFALGGHSLLATRVVSRVREAFGVEMPVRLLFEAPTVEGIAGWIERETGEVAAPRIVSRDESGDAPLSFAQQRLWFIDRFDPGNNLYNSPIFLRARGDLQPAVLSRVLEEVQRRHEALRTVFPAVDGVPVQRVLPPAAVLLPLVDLSGLPVEVREPAALRLAMEEARRPFDLATGPVWRPLLARLDAGEHLALFTLHHIVSDGWSLGVMVREVGALYAAFAAGQPSPLPELSVQYGAFARWQRQWLDGEVLERELAYWRERLAGPPAVLELPADRPRPKVQTVEGATRPFRLPERLTGALQDLARREAATLFMVLLAGYQAFLSRLTGQMDVAVGTPVAGRTLLETEPLIGVFVNTLVLRGDLSGDPPFRELLAQAREAVLGAHSHQAVPFEKLVEELEPERDLAHTPLFQTMLVLQNAAAGTEPLELPGLTLEPAEPPEGLLATSPFELSLILGEQEQGLVGGWEHSTGLFDGSTIERWSGAFARLLEGAVLDPQTRLSELPLLGEAERHQVLAEWNGSLGRIAADGTVHERIARQAALAPEALAVVAGEIRWTYADLEARAEEWAGRLRQLGVGPEVPVAVSLERSAEALAVLLGVLKAGGAYLPIDPAAPVPRRAALLRDSGARVVVSGSDLLSSESSGDPRAASEVSSGYESSASVVGAQFIAPASARPVKTVRFSVRTAAGAMNCAPTMDAELRGEEDRWRRAAGVSPKLESGNLAYILYTSGSTGEPKGVAVEHGALLAHLETTCRVYGLGPGDRILQFTSLSFDASMEQILGTWLAGATLVLRGEDLWSPAELLGRIADLGITFADLPTAYWQQWVREMTAAPAPPSPGLRLRVVTPAGEAMPWEEARLWAGTPAGGARLLNGYGPTEAVITATGYTVPPGGVPPRGPAVPIGRSLPGRSAWILDGSGRPVPLGVAGELCLAGPQARGYLGRPAATAERFVPDPWCGRPGSRLYRTGDLSRWLPSGEIEFLGRTDRQVKVRGFRIETGEIEAALASLPGIRECAVEVQGGGEEKALVAFVAGPAVPPVVELRERLRERLPAYMIPASFVILPELPLTTTGKVDRRALVRLASAQRFERLDGAPYIAPRDAVEEIVAAAWSELLDLERVGVHDSFFDLGGHSLLATRVTSRLHRAFGIEVPLRDLFEEPTVAGLAARIRGALGTATAAPVAPPLVPVPRDGRPLPLSFAQQRLWFLDRLEPGSAVYNIPTALRLSGPLHVPALAAALTEIVHRHEALRTVFALSAAMDGEPVQRVLPAGPASLPLVDLATLPEASREAEARRLARAEARAAFDLGRGPLLRTLLVRLGAEEHDAHLTLHHIVGDGWSKGLLLREIAVLYGAFRDGRPSPLPPLPVQYGDYAAWQRSWLRGQVLEEEIGHWRRELAGLPAWLDLPTDRPRPPVQTARGALRLFGIPPAAGAALNELARSRGATLFMVLLAGFQALLGRLSGQERLAVGTPVAGRNRLETEGLIGFFVNTLVLRGDLTGDPSFGELVGRAREVSLTAQAHPEVPFEKLVEELAPERSLSHSPLFQEMLVFQNTPQGGARMPGLAVRTLPAGTGTAKFDLTLSAGPAADGGLAGALEYNSDLFEAATAERMIAWLRTLLDGGAARPDLPLSALPLLTEEERHQLRSEWNDRGDSGQPGLPWPSLHAVFEAQAARTPEAPALVWEGETISYRDLDCRANRLAHHLRTLGAGPERVVAVRLPRTPELVVTLLAALKSGSAYLPLDPSYPEDRIAFMLADANVVIVVTPDFLEQAEITRCPETPPVREADPGHLAYLIYTSGSTGRPKGVAIEHASAIRMLAWAGQVFSHEELSGVLASTSVNFDISVFELFAPLSYGGTVILAENALALPSLAAAGEVTLLNTVPSAAAALLDLGPLPASIRTVNLAGEALRRPLVDRLYAAGIPRVVNLYGPSEDTTYSTFMVVPPGEAGEPLIGRPLDGTQAYVVDGHARQAPLGIPGELCLGGGGLARGYLGRPALTAERFVPDPFGEAPGTRLYRTGDRVRLRPDGNLEFLGRFDHQVKIRGVRIELGEIEALLAAQPAVREAVVVVRDEPPAGRRLVACVALMERGSVAELREALRRKLPEPMVPAVFVELEALPRTPNGKVDRAALPAPGAAPAGTGEPAGPRTPTEELLAEIWGAVLGHHQVGAGDDFFLLGGHSLLAVQVVSRIREAFGVELPVRSLFEAPTLAALADRLEAARREGRSPAPPLRPVSRDRDLPLSFAQERLWLLDRLEPGNPAYHLPTYVRFEGDLRPALLARCLERIVARHEVLRTVFAAPGGRPVQQVLPPPEPGSFSLPEIDLRGLPEERREGEARRLAIAEAREPFDLQTAGPLRARRVRLGETDHLLLLTVHHVAYDAGSAALLTRELAETYSALLAGREPDLPELPVQYADYAAWQREWLQGEALAEQLAYWRQRLAGAPPTDLPGDRPRPAARSGRGATVPVSFPPDLAAGLAELARREGATVFMVLVAAYQAWLARLSGQADPSVGTPVANRGRRELEGLIGFFINTLVLRGDARPGRPFREQIARARRAALEAYDHREVPFEKIVEELVPARDLSRTPLFQVMLAFQEVVSPASQPAADLPGLRLRPLDVDPGGSKFDLSLSLVRCGSRLDGVAEFDTDLFDVPTMLRYLRAYEVLLRGAAGDPEARLGDLPLLAEPERFQLQAEWNDSRAPYPGADLPLQELVAARIERTPDAVAVAVEGQKLTYAELGAWAGGIAHQLRELGVGPEVRVGLFAERSLELVPAILGILAAGGVYVPLDPDHPAERLAYVIEDAAVSVILVPERLADALPPSPARRLNIDKEGEASWAGRGRPLPHSGGGLGRGFHAAYILYTSGSTGRPKGVVVSHGAIVNRVLWAQAEFPLQPSDRTLLKSPISFDASVWEIFAPLVAGARLSLAAPGEHRDPARLAARLADERLTVLVAVPTLLRSLLPEPAFRRAESLRYVFSAGEALAPELKEQLLSLLPITLVNLYGPTEVAIDATVRTFRRGERDWAVPIGRSLGNVQVYVLDPGLQPVPVGVPGELCVGGAGVARGYNGRPDLTAEKFIPDSFAMDEGRRLYRTGDLARRLPDGQVEYLGRVDQQVKLRGVRIELGEVEAALREHPAVREAAVLAAGGGLAVFVVGRDGKVPAGELRDFLRTRLPEAMVPSTFVALEALPLTTSGKVDRLALSRIDLAAGEEDGAAAPRGPVEEIVASVWADLLGRERIGAGDDFFALGGHSLLAAQAVSRLRVAFGVEVPLRDLFEEPTVAGLSRRIEQELGRDGGRPAAPPVTPAPRDGDLPLSFAQQRLWVIDQIEPESPLYNIPVALRLAGPLNVPALAGALAEVVRRHEALRTVFAARAGGPVQRIRPAGPFGRVPLPVVDLSALPAARREMIARELAAEEALRPFDLREGPVFRAGLLRMGTDEPEHALLLTVHHIVSDGWSAGILVREVTELYRALLEGRPSPLPELPVQYADFAVWQRRWLEGEALAREVAAWREALAGLPAALELPTDRPRPAIQSFRGAGVEVAFPAELSAGLRQLARREGATLFMVLLAGFQALLGRLAGARDLAVGAPVAGRNRVETEGLIGFFVNTLVLRGDLTGEPGLRELVARARVRSIAAHAHQDVPFEKLVEELAPERSLSRSPLFQVALSFQSYPVQAPDLPGLALRPLDVPGATAKFDLTLALAEANDGKDSKDSRDSKDDRDGKDIGGRILGSVEYNTDLFDRATVLRWMGSLQRLLVAALAEPERSVWDLPLASESERHQILREWNDNGLPGWPGEAGIAERFAAVAASRSGEPALAFTDGRLTYGELDARANRLARHLLALGLEPEGRVGLFLERSAALIVATLAVIKAGGVYVPLDPAYPAERLGFMMRDAGLSVVVTAAALSGRLAEAALPLVLLDQDAEAIAAQAATSPEVRSGGDGLAYVMYTSGSTGRPKGIGIPQRAILRLVLRTNYIELSPGDRVAQASNTSFDAATFEIWGALLNGACLVGIPREVALSPEDLAEMLEQERITVLFLTTALFQQLAADRPDALATVRHLLFGGEFADPARLRELAGRERRPERILHVYGPTEGTTYSTWYPTGDPAREASSVPIGRPLAASTAFLVDPQLRPVALGSAGELCVGGEGLARGYLGRPALTAEKFVPDPFSGRPGARLYRTGDLCRWLPSGDLDFLGRFDHQVKLRGFRIELGEIEAALAEQAGVREAVVIVREDLPGDRRLVAYVVPAEPGQTPGLKESLRGRLPDYMIPSAFVEMESLPLTPNGKVDRAALPAPEGGRAGSAAAYVEPGTALEREIAAAVKEVLGLDRVGRDDSFFDLGAHSLSMIRIAGALTERLGRPVKVLEIFRFPNVAALARHLGEAEETPISREVHDRRADARRQSMGRRREMRKGRS